MGILPDRTSVIRLFGAVLAEQNDEWADGRRYLGLDILNHSRLVLIDTTNDREETTETPARSAPEHQRQIIVVHHLAGLDPCADPVRPGGLSCRDELTRHAATAGKRFSSGAAALGPWLTRPPIRPSSLPHRRPMQSSQRKSRQGMFLTFMILY